MLTTFWRRGRLIWDRPGGRRVLLGLMLLAGIGIALWTVVRDWSNLVHYDWQFDWVYLALSSATYAASLALAVVAWSAIMYALKARLSWKQNARFFMYSWMARRLPTAAPFVASRVMLYEQAGVPRRLTLAGMLWEQILLIASSGVLVVLLFPFTPLLGKSIPLLPLAILAVVSVFLALRPRMIARVLEWMLRRWHKDPLTDFLGLPATIGVFVLHALVWLMGGLILFLMVRSIYGLDWAALPVIVQIWVASGLVGYLSFFIPVGLGLSDVSMAVLLALVVPLSVALIIVLLIRLWLTLNELLWALVFSRL
jgi:hypothetical protein